MSPVLSRASLDTNKFSTMDMSLSIINDDVKDVQLEDNTYKHFYYPLADYEDPKPYKMKRTSSESFEELFNEPTKKKQTKRSTTVGRPCKDHIQYISSNIDDGSSASHLMKIEIIDMKKIKNLEPSEYWKHADIRVKYYTKPADDDVHRKTRQLVYHITKGLTDTPNSRKYSFKNT